MAKNKFKTHHRNLESPAASGFAITPNDSTDLPYVTRAIYVGGAGNLVVDMINPNDDGTTTVTLVGVVAGSMYPISATRIRSTNTTCTNLVGFY